MSEQEKEKPSYCGLSDKEKFMALMILNQSFQDKILDAVKKKNRQEVEKIIRDCEIELEEQEIENIMSWDDLVWMKGYRQITDIAKQVYNPDFGTW